MNRFQVRLAGPADWETIVDFNCLLASETENKELDREKIQPGVRAVLADASKGRYFVACEGDRTVGQMMHTWEWSDWRNGQIWWLQSVYVHPDYRKQGVFRQLYEYLLNEARKNTEVVGIRLYVERANHRAQKTYQRLGITQAGYYVLEQLFE